MTTLDIKLKLKLEIKARATTLVLVLIGFRHGGWWKLTHPSTIQLKCGLTFNSHATQPIQPMMASVEFCGS